MPRNNRRSGKNAADYRSWRVKFMLAMSVYAVFILVLILIYANNTRTQIDALSSSYQSSLSNLQYTSAVANLSYEHIASEAHNGSVVLLANNSTVAVRTFYAVNFTAPFDGYLLLYLYNTNTTGFDFTDTSNTTESYFARTANGIKAESLGSSVSAYILAPNVTGKVDQLYIMPVTRGNDTFFIVNSHTKPASFRFSLLYVGEPFANVSIDRNFT